MTNRIKERRDALGWTQNQLAEMCDTSVQQIQRLESGSRRLFHPLFLKISAALGERPTALIDNASDVSPAPGRREFAQDADEARILLAWRVLSRREQLAIKRFLRRLIGTPAAAEKNRNYVSRRRTS